MGFFSDLKEDLSQAVSELMPDETADAEQAESQTLADMVDRLDAVSEAEPDAALFEETGEAQTGEDELLAELFVESESFSEASESGSELEQPALDTVLASEDSTEDEQSEEDKLLAELFDLTADTGDLVEENAEDPDIAADEAQAAAEMAEDGTETVETTEEALGTDILTTTETYDTMSEPAEAEAMTGENTAELFGASNLEAELVTDASESGIIEESIPDASENSVMEESMPDTAENNMIEESMPDTAADTEIIKEAEADKMSEEVMEMDSTAVNEEGKGVEKEGVKNMQEQLFGENEVASDEKSVITEGMTITGDIISKGSLEIFGTITGNIEILGKLDVTGVVNGNSKAAEIYAESAKIVGEVNSLGSVKVGQSSVIIGNIMASSAVVAGAVKGDIDVKGPVILDTSAIVMGNIKSKSVQINNGAVVEGMCSQCYADVNPTAFFDEFKKTAKI